MATNEPPEQKCSGTNGSTEAVIEFDNGQKGFSENSPFKPVVETFHDHGLGTEVSWRTMVTEVDHDPLGIMQVIDVLEDVKVVTETEHSGEQWFRMEDTPPTRTLVGKVTDL